MMGQKEQKERARRGRPGTQRGLVWLTVGARPAGADARLRGGGWGVKRKSHFSIIGATPNILLRSSVMRSAALVLMVVLLCCGVGFADEELALKKGDLKVVFSGLLEAEASYVGETGRVSAEDYTADIVCATAQFGLDALLKERLQGKLVLLWEEDDTEPYDLDEGWLRLNIGKFCVGGGRRYLNFGVFESMFVSDPLTLELGETSASAAFFGFEKAGLTVEVLVFNGDVEKADAAPDRLDALNLGIQWSKQPITLHLGWVSELAESDGVPDGLTDVDHHVGGVCGFCMVELGKFKLILEAVSGLRRYASADLDVNSDGRGDKPFAWGFEAQLTGLNVKELGEMGVGLRIEGAGEVKLPKLRYGVAVGVDVADGLSVTAETLLWQHDKAVSDGLERGYGFALQISYEF